MKNDESSNTSFPIIGVIVAVVILLGVGSVIAILSNKPTKHTQPPSFQPTPTASNYSQMQLRTFYILTGQASIETQRLGGGIDDFSLVAGQGILLPPDTRYKFSRGTDFTGVMVSASPSKKSLTQRIDQGTTQQDIPITGPVVLTGKKRVIKPWGEEIWLTWTSLYALKVLYIKPEQRLSLQFHRRKQETSWLYEGQADIQKGPMMDINAKEKALQEEIGGVDFSNWVKRKDAGYVWTVRPYEAHRITAGKNLVKIIEVSTPELDDVVRLHDDNRRPSGRITEEHLHQQ